MREGGLDNLPFQFQVSLSETNICNIQILTLSESVESMIMSPAITVHNVRTKGVIKKVSALTSLPSSMVP